MNEMLAAGRAALGALVLSISLSGCGPYLGSYRFENARLVSWPAFSAIDAEGYPEAISPDLLRIEFSSDENLETASGGGDLYVHADFCPFSDEYRILALGPYYNDRSRYRELQRTERALPDCRTHIVVEGENLHPARDPRTNRYVYTAYVVPSRPARTGAGGEAREAYDLRAGVRDLCLRLDHPGYYLTRSRSGVFVVPGAALAAALRQGSPSRNQFRGHNT